MALLMMTVAALIIVWCMGTFDIGGFDSYRTMLIIFLGVAALLQATSRTRVR